MEVIYVAEDFSCLENREKLNSYEYVFLILQKNELPHQRSPSARHM